MEDLIKFVSEKAGITPEKAKSAVAAVADFAKQKFPAYGGQIEKFLSGGGGEGGGANPLGDIAGKLGGLFGK